MDPEYPILGISPSVKSADQIDKIIIMIIWLSSSKEDGKYGFFFPDECKRNISEIT